MGLLHQILLYLETVSLLTSLCMGRLNATPAKETTELKPTWECPPGWKVYNGSDVMQCIWYSEDGKLPPDAKRACKDMDADLVSILNKKKQDFLVASLGSEYAYWTALRANYGAMYWDIKSGDTKVRFIPSNNYRPDRYQSSECAVLISSENKPHWMFRACHTSWEYRYICQKDRTCLANHFGGKCESECHCNNAPCKFNSRRGRYECAYGCQVGWRGPACSEEKQEAEITYYCINALEKQQKYVRIMIDTKGVTYRLKAVGNDGADSKWCNGTSVSPDDPKGFITIVATVTEQSMRDMDNGTCNGQAEGTDTYTWNAIIEKTEGLLNAYDQEFSVTCNFSDADTLKRAGGYQVGGGYERHVSKLKVTHEEVVLDVVDPSTGLPLSEAPLSSAVVLQMRYGLEEGSLVTGVTPYNCEVVSSDGRDHKQLLDRHGCRVHDSPVHEFTVNSTHSSSTEWFPLFGFEGVKDIIFQCSFKFCFKNKHCPVTCIEQLDSTWRRRRRNADESDDSHKSKSVMRTIHVLPVSAGKPDTMQTSWFQGRFDWMSPFLYVLFSVIGCILLMTLLGFHWSTKKSVDEVRRELTESRLYNKLLRPTLARDDNIKI